MKGLFREEAIKGRARRLDGAVVLASPASVRLMSVLLAAIVLGALAFASMVASLC